MNDNTVAPAPASTPTQEQDSEAAGFFQEDNGNYSPMRLMSMVALIAAIAFGFLTILGPGGLNNAANTNGIYITFGFLISAFAPKAVQKFAEQKIPVLGSNKPRIVLGGEDDHRKRRPLSLQRAAAFIRTPTDT